MAELDDLRRQIASLQLRNDELLRRAEDAEQVMAALARGEVDAITLDGSTAPVLLHEAQDALRRNEALFRAVIEKSAEAISLTGPDGITRYLTPSAWRLLGWTREEMGTKTLRDQVIPEDRARIADELSRLKETGARDMSLEFRVQHRDGSLRWIESTETNLLDDPNVRAIVGNYRDITERKASESAVAKALLEADLTQRRIRAQFHGVPVPTYVWQRIERDGSRQFVLVDFNQAALTFSDGGIAKYLGTSAATYFKDTPELFEEIERCLDQEITTHREMDQKMANGEVRRLFVTYTSAPPDLVLAHAEDITARIKLEEQFRQVQKMDAVGRLAGGIAHDFNNLLSIILSYASLSIEDLKPGDPLRDDLQEIQAAGQRATELTRQLLAFSRQQVLQPRVVDLNEIMGSMRSMLGRLLGEDIELNIVAAEGLGRVLADPGQIEQVVMNLAVNARDAMPQGGKLTLELDNVELDATYVKVHLGVVPGAYVVLTVSDTGTGMDAATCARIFEPFFTTKDQGKGTGLGLSTVFGIVEQSQGHVSVYSELERGTTFKVYLPRTERAAEFPLLERLSAKVRGAETILLVEDEEPVRQVACAILRRNGYVVLDASNGGEALLISKETTAKIDILLTDVVMPRMSGRKLSELLAVERPKMKVCFTSGYTDDAIVRHGVLNTGVAFLQKPFTPDALLRKVREVLDAPTPATTSEP